MAGFKAGDKVRVIQSGSGVRFGQTGTVLEDSTPSIGMGFVKVQIDGGSVVTVFRRRFELVEPEPAHPFKVGDRVRVKSAGNNVGVSDGDIVTVVQTDVEVLGNDPMVYVETVEGKRVGLYTFRLELVDELTPRAGDKVRVTLEGTLNGNGQLTLGTGDHLPAAWIQAGKTEILERPEPPYEAQKGDIARLAWSNGEGLYTFDGERWILLTVEKGNISPGNDQSRQRGQQMIREGFDNPLSRNGQQQTPAWRYGGELVARDGAPV